MVEWPHRMNEIHHGNIQRSQNENFSSLNVGVIDSLRRDIRGV